MSPKNCMVAQSGGPTVAINASLAGVIDGVMRSDMYELKNGTSAEYGIINVEIWIFGSGSYERYLPVLDIFKQGLLLLFVKILYLIKVQQNAVHAVNGVRIGNNVLDVGYSR